ncbi:MAG: formylmethanofuran dehydrogenase subunit E family protein [Thermodesulfobacteriota bacterium]|nr:formylmethanofuran dehydrogenase subunit E family protein [Thermodesulfobacteriota bacterium]
MICGRTQNEAIQEIENFHGFVAPGLLIGAFMVDLLYEHLDKGVEADAIVETRQCLPDAVQIFTPCTVGNGWLKILDLGKFAITMFDRNTFEGYRTWLDLDKARAHPDVYNWFMGLVSKKDLPKEILLPAIMAAGKAILSINKVNVVQYGKRQGKGDIRVCENCNEAYAASQGSPCSACQGNGYYKPVP